MATKQTILFPPPLRFSKLEPAEQKYLLTLQNISPLRVGDSSAGPYSEALPAAGLNSSTGQSNQNQELIFVKGSADANNWTITGAVSGAVILAAQYAFARFKSDGTRWWRSG